MKTQHSSTSKPQTIATTSTWTKARGSCGCCTGSADVFGAYVSGVALFAFESCVLTPEQPFFTCVATGHGSCGGATLEAAQAAGLSIAINEGVEGTARRLTRGQFDALMDDSQRHYPN